MIMLQCMQADSFPGKVQRAASKAKDDFRVAGKEGSADLKKSAHAANDEAKSRLNEAEELLCLTEDTRYLLNIYWKIGFAIMTVGSIV